MEIPTNLFNLNNINDSDSSSQAEFINPSTLKHEIHVLVVDYNKQSMISTAKMLEQCSYQVTKVKLATSAVKIISSGKKHFDVVMADVQTPDTNIIQRLLEESLQKDMLVIFTAATEDPHLACSALENGAFLFIQKPANEELMRYLWQFVIRERLQKNYGEMAKITVDGKNNGISITEGQGKNSAYNGGGEENWGEGSENDEVSSQKTTRKRKDTEGSDELNPSPQAPDPEPIPDDNFNKKKVCTEWTKELHKKFMDAVNLLGEGKCYPKEILEIMQVPGLTRMQVASHLQKCRHDNWRAPDQRKYRSRNRAPSSSKKQAKDRQKLRRFGTMPVANNKSKGQGQRNPELPITSSVPSGNTNTDARVDPENGEAYMSQSDDTEQIIIMEMLNGDPSKFPIWRKETSPGRWNGTPVPSPSPATTTAFDMASDYHYRPNMPTLDSADAAMESNVSHQRRQQTTDDLSFEFDDDINMDYLIPDFLDLVEGSELNNESQDQSNPIFIPSNEVFPQQLANEFNAGTLGQTNYMQGGFADASRFQP